MRVEINKNFYNKKSYSRFMLICALFICIFLGLYLFYENKSQFRFSEKSGFYEDSFDLKILGCKANNVYYTLDGSEPTTESNKYVGPIKICDRTNEPNNYSQIQDISTGYYKEIVEAYSYNAEDPQYVLPQHNVDKCTIIRASMLDKQGNCIDEISGVYFVGKDLKEKYSGIKVVSIAADPYDLFDYYDGIYVAGADFGKYIYQCETSFGYNSSWWASYWYMWPANYRRRGFESEREARVDIINDDNNVLISQSCGIRVQGDGSRGKLPRNLKLISREEYSGSRYFQNNLLESDVDLHKYVLFGGGDDNIFKIKDYLANSMESELNFATMKYEPCVLFLEGEFWGTYYISEYYDDDYIQTHYDVPHDNVVIYKEGEIVEGNEEDNDLYSDMVTFISENDMSNEENYKKACELIDVDSYIEYYAAQIFIGRWGDWPGGNEAAWRSRDINLNSKYQDGKWRWMLFDLNSEDGDLEITHLEDDTLGYVIYSEPLFSSLIKNESFKKLFCQRMLHIENSIYSEDKVNTFFKNYYDEMLEVLCMSNYRFYEDERRNEIIANAENIKTFLLKRHIFIDNSIENHFGEEYLKL